MPFSFDHGRNSGAGRIWIAAKVPRAACGFRWRACRLRVFLRLVLDFPGPGLVPGRPLRSTSVSEEQGRPVAIVACRSDCPTRGLLWSYVARAGLDASGDAVVADDGCPPPRALEDRAPERAGRADSR